MSAPAVQTDVAIVGGGPAGLSAAIALSAAGVGAALIAKEHAGADYRTTALLAGSVTALDTLGVWTRCRAHAAPLRIVRIIDDTGALLRAPELACAASEIGLDAFGYNIENRSLLAALAARARELPALTLIEDAAETLDIDEAAVTVRRKSGGTIAAQLAIAADGRQSRCRAGAGIDMVGHPCRQTAITCNFRHSRPHRDTVTEFHTGSGPFTLVPLAENRSSLVFVLDSADAADMVALSDTDMAAEIERRSHSVLGTIEVEPGRGVFALTVETATRLGARRVVLVGEAAHVVPPIGAQGLNLGLRDVATACELVVAAHREGRDVGADDVTDRYERMRRADVTGLTFAIDLLNRSLISDFLPLQGARSFGLFLMDRIAPLRRLAMREIMAPTASQPRLMRGEPL